MKTYHCIIIDDSQEAVNLIEDHVNKISNLKTILATTHAANALEKMEKDKPDIIFLDIEMPELSGLEIIEILRQKWGNDIPKIVFITGYTDYALDGYEHGVVDYLLKPVSYSRFKKCINRIMHEIEKPGENISNRDFCFIEADGKKLKVNYQDIVYIEGARNYIILGLTTHKMVLYNTMQAMQALLPEDIFLRTHKSYIININKIHSIKGHKIIVMINDKEKQFPVGITYREKVNKSFNLK